MLPSVAGPAPVQARVEQDIAAVLRQQGFPGQSREAAHQLGTAVKQVYLGNNVDLLAGLSQAYTRFTGTTHIFFDVRREVEFSAAQLEHEARKTAAVAQWQLDDDVQALDRINTAVDRHNERVVGTLKVATGQALPYSREPWERWWVDLIGYRYNMPSVGGEPTIIEQVPIGYRAIVKCCGRGRVRRRP